MKKTKNSIGGVFAGILLLIGGTVLLWWNEGNNVRNIATTNAVEKEAIEVKADAVDSKNEGKLVLVGGEVNVIDESVKDEDFGLSIKTPKLDRDVEVYQWVEHSTEDEDGTTTYSYSKEWVKNKINDTKDFNTQSGHENPTSVAYPWTSYLASEVQIGNFKLATDQINRFSTSVSLSPEGATLPEGYSIDGGSVTNVVDNNPNIGDVRITWKYNNWKDATILAVQKGDTFADYISKEGKHVNRLEEGRLTIAEVVQKMRNEDKMIKWLLRGVGALLIIFGYLSILGPISKLASFVPILGGIVGGILSFIGFVVGIIHSLIIIIIAWFRFRPVLSIALIAVIAVLVALIVSLVKKNKNKAVPTQEPVEITQ